MHLHLIKKKTVAQEKSFNQIHTSGVNSALCLGLQDDVRPLVPLPSVRMHGRRFEPWTAPVRGPGATPFRRALADSSSLFLEVLRREEWGESSFPPERNEISSSRSSGSGWRSVRSPWWELGPTSCDVKIKEIAVKDRLHHSRHDCDLVEEAFCVIAPHPVCDVEGAVKPKEEQVVGSDGLGLARFGDHEELGHYGHWLQEDGEGPQDLGAATRKES